MLHPKLAAGLLIVLGACVAPPPTDAQESSPPAPARREYMGRTIAPPMQASGAAWLVRQSRDAEENPRKLLAALDLRPGQTICDFGCGNGYYTLQIADRVGPRGAVYAVDIQQEMLDELSHRAGQRGLGNIRLVRATETDPGLPDGTFDLVLMVDVYHELADPVAVLAAVRRSLKPSGRLVVAEFRDEDPELPIHPLHRMTQAQVMREIPANGLKLVGQFDELPWQHLFFFARDDSPLPPHVLAPWRAP